MMDLNDVGNVCLSSCLRLDLTKNTFKSKVMSCPEDPVCPQRLCQSSLRPQLADSFGLNGLQLDPHNYTIRYPQLQTPFYYRLLAVPDNGRQVVRILEYRASIWCITKGCLDVKMANDKAGNVKWVIQYLLVATQNKTCVTLVSL